MVETSVASAKLERVLEPDVLQFSSDSFSHPDVPVLERALELRVGMAARGHERMFPLEALGR